MVYGQEVVLFCNSLFISSKHYSSLFNFQANEMLQAAKVSQNKLERRQHLIEALKVSLDFFKQKDHVASYVFTHAVFD